MPQAEDTFWQQQSGHSLSYRATSSTTFVQDFAAPSPSLHSNRSISTRSRRRALRDRSDSTGGAAELMQIDNARRAQRQEEAADRRMRLRSLQQQQHALPPLSRTRETDQNLEDDNIRRALLQAGQLLDEAESRWYSPRRHHREHRGDQPEEAHPIDQRSTRGTQHHAMRTAPLSQTHPQATSQQPQNPPAPLVHRVYLINCRSCGAFLTDRGMKAVLLLRPHITLYSTDAMPHCGPLHAPSRLAEPSGPNEPLVERTCDCLTQTLGCFGCGSAVGYHIVSPCARCTTSVNKHHRSSNGHRTVLHCAEITVRHRRYVPGEPGVLASPSALPSYYRAMAAADAARSSRPMEIFMANQALAHAQAQYHLQQRNMSRHRSTSRRSYRESLVTTGPEERTSRSDEEEEVDEEDEEDQYDDDEDEEEDEEFLDEEREEEFVEASDKLYCDGQQVGQAGSFAVTPYRSLKRGDILYWSDLAAGGERATPIDSEAILEMPVAGR